MYGVSISPDHRLDACDALSNAKIYDWIGEWGLDTGELKIVPMADSVLGNIDVDLAIQVALKKEGVPFCRLEEPSLNWRADPEAPPNL